MSSTDPKNSTPPPKPGKVGAPKSAAKAPAPKPRAEFESHKVRRAPAMQQTPWYNNWRLLVPIAAVILLAVVLLGFAIGQASSRANAPAAPVAAPAQQQPAVPVAGDAATPAAGGAAPPMSATAIVGGRSVPVEFVTSTPVPKAP